MSSGSEWTVVSSGKSKGKGTTLTRTGTSATRKQSSKQWQLDGAMALAGVGSDMIDANVVNESEVSRLVDLVDRYRNGFDGQPIGEMMKSISNQFLQSRSVTDSTDEVDAPLVKFSHVVALGIGSIARSPNAQLQFGLLLFLRDLCRGDTPTSDSDVIVTCYDPSMTATDVEICRRVGVNVMTDNTKGFLSFSPTDGACTLVYMPHCPYRLYCNVLWSLWSQLSNIFLVGNSFQSYALRRGFPGHLNLAHTSNAGDEASTPSKKKKQQQQQRQRQSPLSGHAVTDGVADVTDSVALLTPLLHEVLLPSTLHNSQDGHFATNSSAAVLEAPRSATTAKTASSSLIPSHLLEAAFCELRYRCRCRCPVMTHPLIDDPCL